MVARRLHCGGPPAEGMPALAVDHGEFTLAQPRQPFEEQPPAEALQPAAVVRARGGVDGRNDAGFHCASLSMRPSPRRCPAPVWSGWVWNGTRLQPQPQRLPVDRGRDLEWQQRVAQQRAGQRAAAERHAVERHGGVELQCPFAPVLHVHQQAAVGLAEAPVVLHVHRQERRHVEVLAEAEALLRGRALVVARRQHVAMALTPRGVVDLRDDRLEFPVRCVEAVVEAHRVEAVAEQARRGEQPDRSRRTTARAALDQRRGLRRRAAGPGRRDDRRGASGRARCGAPTRTSARRAPAAARRGRGTAGTVGSGTRAGAARCAGA